MRVWSYRIITILFIIFLFFPIAVTFLYSIATSWHQTLLPEGYTLEWYKEIFSDEAFVQALGRTIFVATTATMLSLVVMVPTVFISVVYFPVLEKYLQTIVMLPYAIPGVIGAVGLIKMYSDGPLVITGTFWILLFTYAICVIPFMYQGIRNSLRTIHAQALMQTAELLGATAVKAFFTVILPNIMPGLLVSGLLSFSVLFGEFVLAKLLVGSGFETIQMYLSQAIAKNGRLSSSVVITYFSIVFLCSVFALWITGRKVMHKEVGK
ncbi:MAG: ABC transporter permease [Bacilli bacterium]